jgi:hypothetical protein
MCNDFKRAQFTLENFRKHNAGIPIRVVNSGGDSPEPYLKHVGDIEFVDAPNLWHKQTVCGTGSFGPAYYDYLFEYGLDSNYTHTLFLETDVLTNRTVNIPPLYDLSGPVNSSGGGCNALYDAAGIFKNRIHTGCGATMFSHKYFTTIKNGDYELYQRLFNTYPQYYYMDLISTLVARLHNLSFGHWEEVSDINYHIVETGLLVKGNVNATLVHNYKV